MTQTRERRAGKPLNRQQSPNEIPLLGLTTYHPMSSHELLKIGIITAALAPSLPAKATTDSHHDLIYHVYSSDFLAREGSQVTGMASCYRRSQSASRRSELESGLNNNADAPRWFLNELMYEDCVR